LSLPPSPFKYFDSCICGCLRFELFPFWKQFAFDGQFFLIADVLHIQITLTFVFGANNLKISSTFDFSGELAKLLSRKRRAAADAWQFP